MNPKKRTKAIITIGIIGALSVITAVLASSGRAAVPRAVPVILTLQPENMHPEDIWDGGVTYTASAAVSPLREAASSLNETEPAVVFPLNLNNAAAEELQHIGGIGPVTAENIISYRDKNGAFKSIDELINISGIGAASIESWREFLYVEYTETTAAEPQTDAVQTSPAQPLMLNLNTATVEELTQLKGVGQATAQSIYDYAREHGFNTVDDLLNVKGIGEKKLEDIRPFVYAG